MRRMGNGRALLIELLVVMLFFALCASVVLDSMQAVSICTDRAEQKRIAMRELQEDAAFMSNAELFEDALAERGYAHADGVWLAERGDLSFYAELCEDGTDAGVLVKARLSARRNGEVMIELPIYGYRARGGETDE